MRKSQFDFTGVVRDDQDRPLVCSGCAHSAASAPFPGHPSGERPCCFCSRNPDREIWLEKAKTYWEKWDSDHNPFTGHWYNGSKAWKVPMDNYCSLDRLIQEMNWDREDLGIGKPAENVTEE